MQQLLQLSIYFLYFILLFFLQLNLNCDSHCRQRQTAATVLSLAAFLFDLSVLLKATRGKKNLNGMAISI